MRRAIAFVGAATLAAVIFAQGQGTQLLANFTKALGDAKSLSTTYVVQPVNGSPSTINVELAKPNLAKIDTPTQLIVADGSMITTLDKKANTFYKKPQTANDLQSLFANDELGLWAGFFNSKALDNVSSSKNLGTKNRKGMSLNVVEASIAKGKKTVTYYLNNQDNVARQAEIKIDDQGVKDTTIIDTKSLVLGTDAKNDQFAFKAPDGSREVSMEEMSSSRWFTDLEEAKALAAKTGKKVFVDFMASWCGPCKMLDREVFQQEDWKKMSKYLVFCKIDVDEQQSVASQYGITAMPTQMILAPDGSVIAKTVGYGGASAFYSFVNGALGI